MTPNEKSLTKARYFRSILKVARSVDDALALRMIRSLANDVLTDDVSPDVLAAESATLAAVRHLIQTIGTRESNVIAAWNGAHAAANQWLQLLS